MDELWTLSELTDRAGALLSDLPAGRVNARVREIPDARTIRWYQTTGLVDRPLMRGRTAMYGPRHLFQLVAIKRLQAQGHTLAEIQAELAGLDTPALERIARVPHDLKEAATPGAMVPARAAPPAALSEPRLSPPRTSGAETRAPAPRARFWADPAEASSPGPSGYATDGPAAAAAAGRPDGTAGPPAAPPHRLAPVQGIRLGPALLVVDVGGRELRAEDLPSLEAAAAPLLAELHRLGLIPDPPDPAGPHGVEPLPDTGSSPGPEDAGPSPAPDTGSAAPTTKEPA